MQQDPLLQRWVARVNFEGKANTFCLVPDREGELHAVIAGIASPEDPFALAGLPGQLPPGDYRLVADWDVALVERAALGWGLGAYQFTRYKEPSRPMARLAIGSAGNLERVAQKLRALYLVRDLVNAPAQDMMPEQLAEAVLGVAEEFGAHVAQIVGDELLEQNYPAIHAVGRASSHAPRLVDLRWGDPAHPRLTLVGKGVCFDSGGLNLKTASGMRLMKKDMGGAAHALGLAQMVMGTRLPVRLRVLVAAVENAVSERALHPGDIIASRKGLRIEIDNTDAEGRLILADALTEGSTENPELLLDFATLTGAARTALGTEIPALFSPCEEVAHGLLEASERERDPLWRLPLYKPYRELLDSKVADIANSSDTPYAGAITAALFLQEFVPPETPWAHLDLMAWNTRARPGRPEGGEAMGLRAVFDYLQRRFVGPVASP
jgi:leucyl aminopeptidase